MPKEIKYIVNGRYVDPNGKDLGEVEGAEREAQQDATTEVPTDDADEASPKPRTRKSAD